MSQHTTSEICPACGSPARVTWLGISAYGHNQPDREIPVSLDCSHRCTLRPVVGRRDHHHDVGSLELLTEAGGGSVG